MLRVDLLLMAWYNGAGAWISMIDVRCGAESSLTLGELEGFQGSLKRRSERDVAALRRSIEEEGLLMPMAVWLDGDGRHRLLDGHGRLEALRRIEADGLLPEGFRVPVTYVTAGDEASARKALLQITSRYGRMTREGVAEFTATIPEYVAPSIARYKHVAARRRLPVAEGEAMIRIAVPRDRERQVRALLSEVEYIRVLG